MLRVSMDAKATVRVGEFSRGGKSRVTTKALDHDFQPEAMVTPVGILLPEKNDLSIYGATSKVTSDCLVDCLEHWWGRKRASFPEVKTILLHLDNGPECHSRRTQFMHRMVAFSQKTGLTIKLAYYPPYHSKYNPIERCWGCLEQHWNGSLLDTVDTVVQFASSMSWQGTHPEVELVTSIYQTGVKLAKDAMQLVETKIKRLKDLGKWFVDIIPTNQAISTG